MFQSFEIRANREAGASRLAKLREEMKREGVTHFLIPHADEHQNEYLPEKAERLAWLTGFTGSAGFAIASLDTCPIFVDGRYTLQVKEQVDLDAFHPESLVVTPPSKWLKSNTTNSDIIGFDPWLITFGQYRAYESATKKSGASLKAVDNLIDRVWEDQPSAPLGMISVHPIEHAGISVHEKLETIRKALKEKEVDATLLTDPASLAWLFNIRGSDLVHNPIPLGYAFVSIADKPILFIDGRKLDTNTKTHLEDVATLASPDELLSQVSQHAANKATLCDSSLVSLALVNAIESSGGAIREGRDPVVLLRAIKNKTEIEGTRKAHIRDGVAMCKFLCWLDNEPVEDLDEINAAQKLEQFRTQNAASMGSELKEISFDTISGHGPNGAIVHYRVSSTSNRKFTNNTLYLSDSGGQYVDGTTDITRTVAIGTPPKNAITDFTLVLKGHIALATARFPEGTRGVDLDVLARSSLWQHGKDYAHGTGHGVGSYLNVHEGPQSISKRGMEPLLPGMIISNEPGYYVEGEYGIRIENLVLVEEAKELAGGNIKTYGFETLTLSPIDLRLVDKDILSGAELNWLNAYHERVRNTLSSYLDQAERHWLEKATKPLK